MPTNPPLTAADLDAIEAAWEEARHKSNWQDNPVVRYGVYAASKQIAELAAALREARALVAALAVDDPGNGDMEYGSRCVWCDVESYTNAHALDCAWAAARAAKARWSGAGEESDA